MSFLSDLFHGNFGNLGEDIAPQNIFKDFGSSFANQPEWAKIAEFAAPAVLSAGLALPELLPAAGAGFAAEGGLAATEAAAPLDLLAGGEAAGTAGGGALSALTPEAVSFFDPATWGQITGEAAIGPDVVPPTPGLGLAPAGDTTVAPSLGSAIGAGDTAMGPSFLNTPVGTDTAFTGGDFAVGPPGAAAGPPNVFGPGPTPFDPGMGAAPVSGGAGWLGPGGVAATAPPAAAADGGGFAANFAQSLSAFPGQVGKALGNPLTDIGIAGLGWNMFQGYQGQQALKNLQQQETDYQNRIAQAGQASLSAARPMLQAGEALMTGGPVPAPMQALLDSFRNAQRARVIQSYGGQSLSTDPQKNTALAQDLNAVDNQMLALREQLGQQITDTANRMLSTGASATQIAAELPMMMQRLDIQLQQMTGNAITNFAAAMSGGTMKVAGLGSGQNINITTGGNPLLTG